jgi:hypothetical protein
MSILEQRESLARDQEIFDEVYEIIGCSLTNLDRVMGEAGFSHVLSEEVHRNKRVYPTRQSDYRSEEYASRTELSGDA